MNILSSLCEISCRFKPCPLQAFINCRWCTGMTSLPCAQNLHASWAPSYWRSDRNSHSASHLWVFSRDVATDSVVKIASGRSNTKWFLLWMYAHMLAQIIIGDKVSLAVNAFVIAIATDTLNMQFLLLLLLLLLISNGTCSPMYERGSISQEISCIKD